MRTLTFIRIAAALLLGAVSVAAFAAQRTFVASYGLDANPCTLVSPCRTFTAAMAQTDINGEVLVLDSAGYGAFTITQSVSVIAPEGIYAGISVFAGQHGVVVDGAGLNVTLRGLTINGQGGNDGIRIQTNGVIVIERVVIANTGNDAADAGIRIASGGSVFVLDSTVRGTKGYGIQINSARVFLKSSRILENDRNGIYAWGQGGSLSVYDSEISQNGVGLLRAGGIEVGANAAGSWWNVTVARTILERNDGYAIFVGKGLSGDYHVSVTDSIIRDHLAAGSGVVVDPNAGENLYAVVANNLIARNTGHGIACWGTTGATATVVAERNQVFDNYGGGLWQWILGPCVFKSMGNNMVENNGTDTQGTITTATLR